jgi:O-antigen/teichoic acid export membrane protein
VGIYAAAARLSDMWYFIPVAIATSMLPMFVERYRQGEGAYRSGVENAYRAAVWIAIPLALGVSLLAGWAVPFLFGSDYSQTSDILRVHVWAAPFIFMSAILGRALITEERRKFELLRNGAGALLNVVLNFALIPSLGGMGAAIATLISYAVTAYFICFTYPPVRPHALLMTRAVARPWPPRSIPERAA